MPLTKSYDITIVGGGLVGASLACALIDSGYRTLVIEATDPHGQDNPSFDYRTIALTHSSFRILSNLGIWDSIDDPCPIKRIHVSKKGFVGSTLLACTDIDLTALGYVVATRELGRAIWARLQHSDIDTLYPATPSTIERNPDHVTLSVNNEQISSKIVILADGGRSQWLQHLGFESTEKDYQRTALLSFITCDQDHDNLAWERFDKFGPIALLPYGTNTYALAWTLDPARAKELASCDESLFLDALHQRFGYRAGRFSARVEPKTYPLALAQLEQSAARRVIAIGNAAHRVHPVAGQGFNLGLRDVAHLHKLLIDAKQWDDDPGDDTLLNAYCATTEDDARRTIQFTDTMLNIFAYDSPFVAIPRGVGLGVVDKFAPLRRRILAYSTGLTSEQNYLNRNIL